MHTIASTHGLHFAAQVAQVLLTDSGTFRAATRWPGLHCADIVAEQYRGLPGSDSFKFARSASTSKFVLGTIFLEKVQLHDVFRIDCLPSVAGRSLPPHLLLLLFRQRSNRKAAAKPAKSTALEIGLFFESALAFAFRPPWLFN